MSALNDSSLIKAEKSIRSIATTRFAALSQPSVIADPIVRAVSAKKPCPRYVAGAFAVPILTGRCFLRDRAFDSVMMFFCRTARP
jgi:hypothetical protein